MWLWGSSYISRPREAGSLKLLHDGWNFFLLLFFLHKQTPETTVMRKKHRSHEQSESCLPPLSACFLFMEWASSVFLLVLMATDSDHMGQSCFSSLKRQLLSVLWKLHSVSHCLSHNLQHNLFLLSCVEFYYWTKWDAGDTGCKCS